MNRASHSDDLPPLQARWASEFLSGPIPAETEATCSDRAMLAGESGKVPPATTPFFNPDTECCTYLPVLPDFLVGRVLADDRSECARGCALELGWEFWLRVRRFLSGLYATVGVPADCAEVDRISRIPSEAGTRCAITRGREHTRHLSPVDLAARVREPVMTGS